MGWGVMGGRNDEYVCVTYCEMNEEQNNKKQLF